MKKNSHNYNRYNKIGGTVPFVRFWLPVYLYAALIFIYSSMSRPPLVPKILHADKLVHLIEYAIFGYLLARAAKNATSFSLRSHFRTFAIVLAVVYGLSDEFHQYFVPGRYAQITDLLADGAGAVIGQLFIRG